MDETRRDWTPRPVSRVYLKGDPQSLIVDLPQEALLAKLADVSMFATTESVELDDCFVKLPLTTGPTLYAFVKPRSIAALLPATLAGDDDE